MQLAQPILILIQLREEGKKKTDPRESERRAGKDKEGGGSKKNGRTEGMRKGDANTTGYAFN